LEGPAKRVCPKIGVFGPHFRLRSRAFSRPRRPRPVAFMPASIGRGLPYLRKLSLPDLEGQVLFDYVRQKSNGAHENSVEDPRPRAVMCRAAMVDAAAHRRCARQPGSERGSDDRPAPAGKTPQPAAEACVSSRQQDDLNRHGNRRRNVKLLVSRMFDGGGIGSGVNDQQEVFKAAAAF
jgi:hypothetical protein